MLKMPESSGSLVSLIGIDPGTTLLGIGIIRVDLYTKQIVSSDAVTLKAKKLIDSSWMGDVHGERFSRISALGQEMVNIFTREHMFQIACESPFFNPGRPNAFGALVEIMTVIRQSVEIYDPWIPLNTVDPPSVKNAVGAKGGAGKDPVKEGVLKLTDINYQGDIPLVDVDEHSVDGLAVAYWLYKSLFKS